MPLGTAATLAVGTGVSALIGSRASNKAARASSDATEASLGLQRDIYDETSGNFAPYRQAGSNALDAYLRELGLPGVSSGFADSFRSTSSTPSYRTVADIVNGVSDTVQNAGSDAPRGYEASPMARYLLETGRDTIEGGAAAGGGLYSGATMKALEDYRQKTVMADRDNYLARLLGLTQMGANAAGNQGAAGTNFAGTATNTMMAGAANQGNAYMANAQNVQGGIRDMAGIYGYYQQNNPMAAYASPTLAAGASPAMSMRPQPNPRFS